jgi:hypothetical protein
MRQGFPLARILDGGGMQTDVEALRFCLKTNLAI